MDIFIDALLGGYIADDEIGDFVSVSHSWRESGEWLDASRYVGGLRFSAYGNFTEEFGDRPVTRNGGAWAAVTSLDD